jgi:hypothetical protein
MRRVKMFVGMLVVCSLSFNLALAQRRNTGARIGPSITGALQRIFPAGMKKIDRAALQLATELTSQMHKAGLEGNINLLMKDFVDIRSGHEAKSSVGGKLMADHVAEKFMRADELVYRTRKGFFAKREFVELSFKVQIYLTHHLDEVYRTRQLVLAPDEMFKPENLRKLGFEGEIYLVSGTFALLGRQVVVRTEILDLETARVAFSSSATMTKSRDLEEAFESSLEEHGKDGKKHHGR